MHNSESLAAYDAKGQTSIVIMNDSSLREDK